MTSMQLFRLFLLIVGSGTVDANAIAQQSAFVTTTSPTSTPQATSVVNADLSQAQSPPSESNVLRETTKLLPMLGKSETKNYIILSDASPTDITTVGSLLEATFKKYLDVCNTLGWQLKPLRHKLVAVVFRDQQDYKEFATKNDKLDKLWAVGYYMPQADRLVLYKSENGDDIKRAMNQIRAQGREVQKAEHSQQAAGNALQSNPNLANTKKQLLAEQDRIHDFAKGSFVSTVVHEAAHQLFFHTDVQRSGASCPLWLAEGLATNFETEQTDIEFGYKVDNWRRRESFKLAYEKDNLIPLQIFLLQERFTNGSDANEAMGYFYAQAYALTNWLLRERPTEVKLYLESLRDGSFAVAQDRQKNFEAIFGPVARLERNWVRYEGRRQKEFLTSPFAKSVLAKIPTAAKTIPADTAKSDIPQPNTAPNQSSTTTLETTTQSGSQSGSQSAPVPPK